MDGWKEYNMGGGIPSRKCERMPPPHACEFASPHLPKYGYYAQLSKNRLNRFPMNVVLLNGVLATEKLSILVKHVMLAPMSKGTKLDELLSYLGTPMHLRRGLDNLPQTEPVPWRRLEARGWNDQVSNTSALHLAPLLAKRANPVIISQESGWVLCT